jgi:hypothetical protein
VRYWSFQYGNLLVGSDWVGTNWYHGDKNMTRTGGLNGSPLSESWSNDPPFGEPLGNSPPRCGYELALMGCWNETSLP